MDRCAEISDWGVLARLLREAQRIGWRVGFAEGRVEISHVPAAVNVVVLPAALLRQARATGWDVVRPRVGGILALRHPAVRHPVALRVTA